jgi:hypothetical protein
MFLRQKRSGDLIEVIDLSFLFDPFVPIVRGQVHAGEEMQEATDFPKADLEFPSGENLPRCWTDGGYRQQALR